MKRSLILKGVLAATLSVGMVGRAAADGSDIIGGVLGGMIGAAIVNGANQQQQQQRNTQPRRTAPAMSSAERAANIEVQTALNHFAFPVGKPDGVLGPRSRSAISQYQALLAFPATGTLTELERTILVTAYQRAIIGGPQVTKVVSSNPMGLRGLLVVQRDEMLGTGPGLMARNDYGGLPAEVAEAVDEVARNSGVEGGTLVQRAGFIQLADMNGDGRSDYLMDTSVTGSGFWCSGEVCAVRVFVSTPDGYRRNDFQVADPTPAAFQCTGGACRVDETVLAGATAAPAAPAPEAAPAAPADGTVMAGAEQPEGAAPALPGFASAIKPVTVGFAAHCKAIGDGTAGRGGKVQTVAAMDDPSQALGEQFCQVAIAARDDGAGLMQQVQGFTPAQIAEQCRGFAAALTDQVKLLEGNGRDTALAEMQTWLANAGMPQDQLVATAKICLSVGYAGDDGAMALASALVIAGTGNMIYGELVGHHLASGVAVARNPERAAEWFAGAAQAVKAGQTPVFLPAEKDRMLLIERAAAAAAGKAGAPPLLPVVPVAAGTQP